MVWFDSLRFGLVPRISRPRLKRCLARSLAIAGGGFKWHPQEVELPATGRCAGLSCGWKRAGFNGTNQEAQVEAET